MTFDQYLRRLYLSYRHKRKEGAASFALWWQELSDEERETIEPWRIIAEDVPGWAHLKELYIAIYDIPQIEGLTR